MITVQVRVRVVSVPLWNPENDYDPKVIEEHDVPWTFDETLLPVEFSEQQLGVDAPVVKDYWVSKELLLANWVGDKARTAVEEMVRDQFSHPEWRRIKTNLGLEAFEKAAAEAFWK